MGEATYKIITIAEIVKFRIKGLHQINDIFCREFKDEYLPREEGLDKFIGEKSSNFIIIFPPNPTHEE